MEERTRQRASALGRLRFVLGDLATDVALPAEVTLADLLPAVLPQFGPEWTEQGAEHEGWIAQRLGGPPLDEDKTPVELALLDGETIYLRPRAAHIATVDYDDLVHGVAERILEHPSAWTARRTRWMFRWGVTFTFLIGLFVLNVDGPIGVRGLSAAVVALLLLCGAAVLGRLGDSLTAIMLTGVSVCYAAVGGWQCAFAVDSAATARVAWMFAAISTLAVLCLGALAVANAALLFAGALTGTLMLTLAALLGVVSPADAQQVAAIALTVTLIAGLFVPATAFRLSGLTLPMLPTNADELREDTDPVPHQVVVERGEITIRYLQALHIGLGLAQVVLVLLFVSAGGGFWVVPLAAVVGVLLFLRSRHLNGAVQRWAMLVPGGVALAVDLYHLAAALSLLDRVVYVWLPVLAAGVGLVVLGAKLPGRRLRPYWGRAVDILEMITAIAVLPLLFALLGIYGLVRGLSG